MNFVTSGEEQVALFILPKAEDVCLHSLVLGTSLFLQRCKLMLQFSNGKILKQVVKNVLNKIKSVALCSPFAQYRESITFTHSGCVVLMFTKLEGQFVQLDKLKHCSNWKTSLKSTVTIAGNSEKSFSKNGRLFLIPDILNVAIFVD